MSVINRVKLSRLIDTVSSLPLVHGDYYRPADRILDIIHAEGFTGDLMSELVTYPSIVSGLVATINVSATTIDITAGVAIGTDSQIISVTEHNYDGVPLTGLDASTGYTHPVNVNSGLTTVPRFIVLTTNLTAQSTASVANSSTGFVKLRYKDQNTFTRNTPSDPTATAYSFLTRDSYELIIDQIAPTSADVCLAEFTKDAFGAITTITTVNREVDTGIQLKNGYLDLPAGNRLKLNDANLTANRIYTLQNRNMTIAGTDDITKLYITASAAIGIGEVVTITGDDAVNTRPQAATLTTAFQIPVGIAEAAIANGAGGYITIAGRVATTLNAATAAVGDPVYATSTGVLSLTRTMWKIGIVATNTANAVIYCNFDFTEDLYTDGSVSAPSVSFESDTDTGLYRIGADNMGFAAGGVQRSQLSSLGLLNGTLGTDFRNILQIQHHGLQPNMINQTETLHGNTLALYIVVEGTIVPKSSSSKIIVMGSLSQYASNSQGTSVAGYAYIHTASQGALNSSRASALGTMIFRTSRLSSTTAANNGAATHSILTNTSSYATTAGTTYYITLLAASLGGSGARYNVDNSTSSLMFIEVI